MEYTFIQVFSLIQFIDIHFSHYLLHLEDTVSIDLTLKTWEHLLIVKYAFVHIENVEKEVME